MEIYMKKGSHSVVYYKIEEVTPNNDFGFKCTRLEAFHDKRGIVNIHHQFSKKLWKDFFSVYTLVSEEEFNQAWEFAERKLFIGH